MKHFIICMLTFMTAFSNLKAQTTDLVTGAWEFNESGKLHHLFFQDGFYFHTIQQGNQFISTAGGHYEIKDKNIVTKSLFNSADSTKVDQVNEFPYSVTSSELTLSVPQGAPVFQRVDNGHAPLAGVWRITGRMQDGKITAIHQTGTRQTYKLLTGSKFQWVAIDPAKKQFSGTGGGGYTFKDGKYTENIEFFSRDNSRVGASLSFDGKLENGDWHHSGLSSKGDKIYEIWSRVGKAN